MKAEPAYRENHLSGRYVLATGQERPGTWLTEQQAEALVYVVSLSGPARAQDVGRDLAYERQNVDEASSAARGYTMLRSLVEVGVLAKPLHGRYVPTERGRIVAALHMARRPDMVHAFFDDVPG